MSPVKTIKTFRDLLSFLTIIPVGGKEDFIFTTAENMWLFPLIGGFIGLLGAAYFVGSSVIVGFLLGLANSLVALPVGFLGTIDSCSHDHSFPKRNNWTAAFRRLNRLG